MLTKLYDIPKLIKNFAFFLRSQIHTIVKAASPSHKILDDKFPGNLNKRRTNTSLNWFARGNINLNKVYYVKMKTSIVLFQFMKIFQRHFLQRAEKCLTLSNFKTLPAVVLNISIFPILKNKFPILKNSFESLNLIGMK